MFRSISIKRLGLWYAITAVAAIASGLLSMNAKEVYASLTLPWFAPPDWLFAPVWTVLYIFLGLAAYLTAESNCSDSQKSRVLTFYVVTLALQPLWALVFFRLERYSLAFLVICALLVLSLVTAVLMGYCRKSTLLLTTPYILWLLYASILNRSIVTLNPSL